MSLRSYFYVLAAIAAALATTTARADSLLERYPHNEVVTLSDGREMALPLHIQDGNGVVLAGLADLEALDDYLAPEGLKAIPMTPEQGFIALYNMNYERTDLGSYKELVICVAATRDMNPRVPLLSTVNDYAGMLAIYAPFLRGLVGDRTQDVLFTWKLYVTEDLPMRAGLDVWGFPKWLGEIDVDVSNRSASFSVSDGGDLVLRGSYRRLLPWSMPVSIDAYLATPLEWNPTINRGLADTESRFGFFLPWDTFEVNPEHPWGAALDDVGFTPRALARDDRDRVGVPRTNEQVASRVLGTSAEGTVLSQSMSQPLGFLECSREAPLEFGVPLTVLGLRRPQCKVVEAGERVVKLDARRVHREPHRSIRAV
jgi:hypothetical protein